MKAEELKALLGEALEDPGTKTVIFSQWIKTHELIIRRLEKMRLPDGKKPGFVFLHGGLSSKERQKIIAQFKEDPACRVFLSTDAGGVGLNLQAASTVSARARLLTSTSRFAAISGSKRFNWPISHGNPPLNLTP